LQEVEDNENKPPVNPYEVVFYIVTLFKTTAPEFDREKRILILFLIVTFVKEMVEQLVIDINRLVWFYMI